MKSASLALALLILAASFVTQFSSTALAQEKRFGAWSVGVISGNDGLYAATVNDSGGVLGQYCLLSDGNCYWLLANNINCDDGTRYPVLINADAGASSTEIFCMKLEGRPRYAFTDFDAIDRVIKASSRIGLAFPLKDGYFSVNRFSLEGASAAVSVMRDRAASLKQNKPGTRDTRL